MPMEHSSGYIQWPAVCLSLERNGRTEMCAVAADLKVIKIKMVVETSDMNIITGEEEVWYESKGEKSRKGGSGSKITLLKKNKNSPKW